MQKKYSTIIILVTLAVVLNSLALGILVSQPLTRNNVNTFNSDNPASKVIARIDPTSLTTSGSTSISTEKLEITRVETNLTTGSFLVTISNNEASQIDIPTVLVNNYPVNLEKDVAIPTNSNIKLLLTLTDGIIFARTYQISLRSLDGQSAVYYSIVD